MSLLLSVEDAKAKRVNLVFSCAKDNDLYSALARGGYQCPRYDHAQTAIERAHPGSAVLLLADHYPDQPLSVDPSSWEQAAAKRLRLYLEYPAEVPGLELGKPQDTVWERAVVSSAAFGDKLPRLRILTINSCRFIPVSTQEPSIVIARVAGFDTAVFGLPAQAQPILFEVPERNLWVATTKLSHFITGRYAPFADWKTLWDIILAKLDPVNHPTITWQPEVHPAFPATGTLPEQAERQALRTAAKWVFNSRLLLSERREQQLRQLLKGNRETTPAPPASEPVGDGSRGVLEGYASAIGFDGSQEQRTPIRADCQAEVAMMLALDWAVNGEARSRDTARHLLDYLYFTSGMCGGVRGNPRHPAFGLISWGSISPAWEIANYGDDNARAMLATIVASAYLETNRWDESLLRALLANLRTTGTLGFRGSRIDLPDLERLGWKHFRDAATVDYSPHYEAYLWACNLWAYRQTKYQPFLERTKTAIKMTMEAYPQEWLWQDSIERARMLLPLAWLVRLEDTTEHRRWLLAVADDLLSLQQSCGAIEERLGAAGGGAHFWAPRSNEAYGTGETPLIQQNGDPASDQLYTTPFALLGLHEAYCATRDPRLKQAEDKLAGFLCRIQVRSRKFPYLDGCWFRAFDYQRWDYWAASGDAGWGAWSVESGWGTAWAAAVLGLRSQGVSYWDCTSRSRIAEQLSQVQQQMQENDGSLWSE